MAENNGKQDQNGFLILDPEKKQEITKDHLKPADPPQHQTTTAAINPTTTPDPNAAKESMSIDEWFDKVISGLEDQPPATRQALIDQLIQLIMQMGSDLNHLGTGGIDQRKFANINELQQMGLAHFNYRGRVDGIRYWHELTEWVLNSSVSVGGLGRRQTIEITAAASGSAPGQFASKPNILVRGLDRLRGRSWRDEAEAKGQIPVD